MLLVNNCRGGAAVMWAHSRVASDGDRCVVCGCDNQNVLEKHHRIPSRYGGSDRDQNTATLCANCHTAIERIYNESFWERVASLDFSGTKPEPDQHQQNLIWNKKTEERKPTENGKGGGKPAEVEEERPSESEQTDLEQLASNIVCENRVSDVETSSGEIDNQLLQWEFDVSNNDSMMLKKLIKREQKKNDSTETDAAITKNARDHIIYKLHNQGVAQKTIGEIFSLTQPTVSTICNNHNPSDLDIDSLLKLKT